MRHLLGFNETTLCEPYNQSHNLVDTLSFENILSESNVGRCMTFRGKRSGIFQKFTMEVDPGH